MTDKHDSHIEEPVRHTTSKGGSYITPFDLIRSKRGRVVVDSHASMAEKNGSSDPGTTKRVASELKPAKVG